MKLPQLQILYFHDCCRLLWEKKILYIYFFIRRKYLPTGECCKLWEEMKVKKCEWSGRWSRPCITLYIFLISAACVGRDCPELLFNLASSQICLFISSQLTELTDNLSLGFPWSHTSFHCPRINDLHLYYGSAL